MNRRRWLRAAGAAGALAWLQACERSQGAPAAAAAAWPGACWPGRPAAAPAVPEDAVNVQQHGVRGDGQRADGEALQRLFDGARPGQTLWFPPGVYLQDRALALRQPGVTLLGHGATLHATQPDSQALMLQADGCRVQGFTCTAVTDVRRMAPWESRIAVWRPEGASPIAGAQILDNRILASGPPGSPRANGSSSAGIYLERASRFVVAGNVVQRSLADGIHITGGSSDGLVAGNQVRESGDDMIAVVSYLGADAALPLPPAPVLAAELPGRRQAYLVRNVLITGNDLAGGYWGRGIAVVGGEDVSVLDNNVQRCTHAAAVYLAREPGWRTFGVRNVRVAGNRIREVQLHPPAYSVLSEPERSARTGHAAIELVAHLLEAEAPLAAELGIHDVLVEDNLVQLSATAGIRVGDGWGAWGSTPTVGAAGAAAAQRSTGAPVRRVALRGNVLERTDGGIVVLNAGDREAALWHAANRVDGQPWRAQAGQALGAGQALATGSSLRCSAPRNP